MKNECQILGDITKIRLSNTKRFAIIDTASLARVDEFPGTWRYSKTAGCVVGSRPRGRGSVLLLSRWISKPSHREWVCFRNGNRFDYRRENLQIFSPYRNEYVITKDGKAALLILRDRSRKVVSETIIDVDDLDRVLSEGRWYLRKNDRYVAMGRNGVLLHRFLLNPPDDLAVDHINGDKLDNRKENLRILSHAANAQNRASANVSSKTGIRGVSWSKNMNKWWAQVKINKRLVHSSYHDNILDAEIAARNARALYMPYSPEAREVQSGVCSACHDGELNLKDYRGGLVECQYCGRIVLFERKDGSWQEIATDVHDGGLANVK